MPDKFVTFSADGALVNRLIKGVHDIPVGALAIDEALWFRLIQETDGVWKLVEGVIEKHPLPNIEPHPLTREEVEALRLRAYADPLTGSDRYFAEAQRMQVMGEDGWEGVRAAGVARFEAIQFLYPWSPPDPDVAELK
ncbi:hypothetical protein L1A22_08630 [Pseudomonas extremaustralis]|uniref:hypothetical protein n=1 Tax=Pseudomonas extremaustralis TaxID=359110 RepID=UPI0021C8AEC0|nr:hypothetical protein [Pseudomonas extremaustralis]UUJ42347.1 hypothetical protein L1A22_08630 [Pseudomonas extremaustralis]